MTRRFFVLGRWGSLVAFAGAFACAWPPLRMPPTVPTGLWGGDHIAMTVTDTGTHVELDCAHGDIPDGLGIDARNQFSVAGTFVKEHGGPIREGEVPDSHPAVYVGLLTSNHLELSIRLADTGDMLGTFALTRGVAGRVVKCL